MDAYRFDDALRAVSHEFSRRGLFAGLTSLLIAVTPFAWGREDADARKKRKKKRRKKKRDQSPAPTCSDGIKNGTESDVDCGGSCPRCSSFRTCAGRDDCVSALCAGTCQMCGVDGDCGSDANGACRCITSSSGTKFCNSSAILGYSNFNCNQCPPGTTSCQDAGAFLFTCYGPCGGV